jgi:ribosome recycling factor
MVNEILDEAEENMKGAIEHFKRVLSGIRGNRASTNLVSSIEVEYYGQPTPLFQLANISTPEALQILIRPYDSTAVQAIEKAIQASDIGINPNVDGSSIRLNVPPLTKERRKDLVKVLHGEMENAKVAIRNIRRSTNSDLNDFEKEKEISEDEKKSGEKKVQELTDKYIKQVEELGKEKETDLMEI